MSAETNDIDSHVDNSVESELFIALGRFGALKAEQRKIKKRSDAIYTEISKISRELRELRQKSLKSGEEQNIHRRCDMFEGNLHDIAFICHGCDLCFESNEVKIIEPREFDNIYYVCKKCYIKH